ncbi:hypothetical protein L873DRAFT_1315161 [Choiromyces venosus 120613-1]|uniref:Uncharacterized protein n=1 Tax=Choiromyces venosus 120613-1 TaxID=1336337 RepID=A0A3N4JNQ6_9PEZI|nr:hypothetical protein L873DRAFT_1315161 [Choiromyces venosus 120613-1]
MPYSVTRPDNVARYGPCSEEGQMRLGRSLHMNSEPVPHLNRRFYPSVNPSNFSPPFFNVLKAPKCPYPIPRKHSIISKAFFFSFPCALPDQSPGKIFLCGLLPCVRRHTPRLVRTSRSQMHGRHGGIRDPYTHVARHDSNRTEPPVVKAS